MLLFSAVLNISPRMNRDRFLELVLKWNAGSVHPENIIPDISWRGERNIRFGNDDLWMEFKENTTNHIQAVRYEKIEGDGVVWDSDYIMDFSKMQMSVRLERSYMQNTQNTNPRFSTPHFISMLIEENYIEPDHGRKIQRTPHFFNRQDLPQIADLLTGKPKYDLPVVIVTKTKQDEYPFDINKLAGRLKGAAHVIVQEKVETTSELRDLCRSGNPYWGSADVIFPNTAFPKRRFVYRRGNYVDAYMLDKIVRAVIHYCNSQRIDNFLTWQGVNNAILRERFQIQMKARMDIEKDLEITQKENAVLLEQMDEEKKKYRASAMEEANELLASYDEDMQKLQNDNEAMTQKIERLEYENSVLRAKMDSKDQIPLVIMGNEPDMFEGEIRDYVLEILSDEIKRSEAGTRKYDVLCDLLNSNEYEALHVQRRQTVKSVLNNYTGMTSAIRAELNALGFIVTDDNHKKIRYKNEERYLVVLAGSPSDWRSGKNNVSKIIKKFL